MANGYIDIINRNMSIMNPSLYDSFKKKFNKKDIAILYLLFKGNSILFISDSVSRTKLYNVFSTLEIEYLICDFDEDIYDESFVDYLIEDSNLTSSIDSNDLLEDTKNDLELTINVLSNTYSNFYLIPLDLEARTNYYLKKIGNHELIYPITNLDEYDEMSVKTIGENINTIIKEYGDIFIFNDYFEYDFFKTDEYKNLVSVSNTFKNNLNNFISLNMRLNKLLGLKIFNDLESIEILENSSVLFHDYSYIDQDDFNNINEIIKESVKGNGIELTSNEIINRYLNENMAVGENILNNVKYTELIDNNIFVDENKMDNLSLLHEKLIMLLNMSRYLKKQLYFVSSFYTNYPYFKLNKTSFDVSNNLNELQESFESFNDDLNKLNKLKEFMGYDYSNEDERFFVDLVVSNTVDKNIISDVFYFNVFNQCLNNFCEEFEFIDRSKLDVRDYQVDFELFNKKLSDSNKNYFIGCIKDYVVRLNNEDLILKQKEDLIKKISNNDFDSIMEILKEFKELILANRRLFIVDENSVQRLNSINYKKEFDYIFVNDEIIPNKK